MYRTLEAIFRRPLGLLLLLVILPIISVGVVYVLIPRTYPSTASLWALRRYAVIGATGIESDLSSTPAQTQATALDDLLQSRSFSLAVANDTNVVSTLNLDSTTLNNPELLDNALVNEISPKNVVVTPVGYSLFQITYANRDSTMAQKVVRSIINHYGEQSQQFSVQNAQTLLSTYQAQLVKAKADVDTATAAELQYLTAHPELKQADLANDPGYQALHSQTLQAEAVQANLEANITTIQDEIAAQGSGPASLFQVLDPPNLPYLPVSRTKYYLIGGILGLVVALLVGSFLLVAQIRRDDTIHTAAELQRMTSFPVIMQLPQLQKRTAALVAEESNL